MKEYKLTEINDIEKVNIEALAELTNGLGSDEDVEELVAMACRRTEIVGANAANNKTFSSLCSVIIPSPNYNPRSDAARCGVSNNKIDTITIHHMAGNLTVETCGNIFANPNRGGSSNYGVGTDGRIAGYVGEENRAWTSSSKYNDFRAVTIEVANDTLSPTWTVSDEALTNTINLVVDICRRNGIKQLIYSNNKNDRVNHVNGCNVTIHSDFAATACCGPYLKALMGNICLAVNNILNGGQPTPVPTPVNPYTKPTSPINSGSRGDSVKWIQWQLNIYKYGLAVDGSYGPATTNAVADFQKKHGLPVTGNCDMNTIYMLDGGQPQPSPYNPPDPYADYSKAFWDFFRTLGMPEYGVAGLIGNISMESAIRPNNLQNSYEQSLHMSDDQYTAAVDNNTYNNFVNDRAGYGLAQWTYPTRKQGLLNLARQCKMSICDINLQLTYLTQELQTKYKGVWDGLFAAKSVLEASNIVLLQFERPKDQSVANQQRRATCCQGYYNKFSGSTITTVFPIGGVKVGANLKNNKSYKATVIPQVLNVRSGAGLDFSINEKIKKDEVCTIVEEKDGWGKLENDRGWVELKRVKALDF